MVRTFRRWARATACVVLASLAALAVSLAGSHPVDCHDDDCVVVVVHDASAHHVGGLPARPGTPPLHCLVCHWARSFRPQSQSVVVAPPVDAAGAWINVEIFTAAPVAPLAQPPLRSPPSSPAFA